MTDETIRAIPRMRWSPDGSYLAVVVAPSSEAQQIVLVSADGLALRAVSPNSQYLWGDVEWSPDGRRIAHIMATGPYGRLPDLFVTDLGPDRVTRVTTGSKLSGYDVVRFIVIGDTVVGEPQGLPRDGSWSLFIRWSATTAGAGTVAARALGNSKARNGSPCGRPR